MKTKLMIIGIVLVLMSSSQAYASPDLYSWMFNIDGAVIEYVDPYDKGGMPVSTALGSNDLGTYTYTETEQGGHIFISYFDYEFDEAINTFFNERGSVSGSVASGQSWQIDSIDNYDPGNIYDNVYDNALNNSNNIPVEGDVSWAMGWDYFLEANQTAVIQLLVGDIIPDSGLFLTQIDNATGERIYFSGSLEIRPVPEPQSFALLGLGCLMFLLAKGISIKFRAGCPSGKRSQSNI